MKNEAYSLVRVEQTRVVWRGLTGAARKLGCSRAHLSYVLHGARRPSAKLAAGLARMGVVCTVEKGAAKIRLPRAAKATKENLTRGA